MSEKRYYVDASCIPQKNIGSWAVVCEDMSWKGVIRGENLRSGYCELYAIKKALEIAKNTNAIIYNDNPCTLLLNAKKEHIVKKMRGKYKDKEMLQEVYNLYNRMPNVRIGKIGRKENRVADKIARKTIKEAIRSEKRNCHNCSNFTNVPTSKYGFLYACRVDYRTALTTKQLQKGECKEVFD